MHNCICITYAYAGRFPYMLWTARWLGDLDRNLKWKIKRRKSRKGNKHKTRFLFPSCCMPTAIWVDTVQYLIQMCSGWATVTLIESVSLRQLIYYTQHIFLVKVPKLFLQAWM